MGNNLKITVLNDDNSVRWNLNIEVNSDTNGQMDNFYKITEDTKGSLFYQPMAYGSTPGKALDNFLLIETDLIRSL